MDSYTINLICWNLVPTYILYKDLPCREGEHTIVWLKMLTCWRHHYVRAYVCVRVCVVHVNSEVDASEILEIREEMFLWY